MGTVAIAKGGIAFGTPFIPLDVRPEWVPQGAALVILDPASEQDSEDPGSYSLADEESIGCALLCDAGVS